jgi:hypothetical protein
VLAQQGIAEYLQELAVQDKASLRYGRLSLRDRPEGLEGQSDRLRQTLDPLDLKKSADGVPCYCRTHHGAIEDQRRANHRQTEGLPRQDARLCSRLSEAALRTFGEQSRIGFKLPKQFVERYRISRGEYSQRLAIEYLDHEARGDAVLIECG